MSYDVAEIFLTLQGEGHWTGRAAVFCRFAGCNLWTGKEPDRGRAACRFCDTDFTPRLQYETAYELADAIEKLWPDPVQQSVAGRAPRMVVLTGGEPTLQVDQKLLGRLHRRGFYVAAETNGTRRLPAWGPTEHGYDWVCVSPKSGTVLRLDHADELKVVWPQPGLDLEVLADFPATHYWLSPMDRRHLDDPDGEQTRRNLEACIDYCLQNPQWRLNIQTHKEIGIR